MGSRLGPWSFERHGRPTIRAVGRTFAVGRKYYGPLAVPMVERYTTPSAVPMPDGHGLEVEKEKAGLLRAEVVGTTNEGAHLAPLLPLLTMTVRYPVSRSLWSAWRPLPRGFLSAPYPRTGLDGLVAVDRRTGTTPRCRARDQPVRFFFGAG